MIIGFVLLILWVFNYPTDPVIKRQKTEICGAIVRSTCTDDFTSKWNRKNVGKNLKLWMDRIEPILTLTPSDKRYHYLSKNLLKGHENKFVRYIANKDCRNKKSYGPTWRIADPQPRMAHQFHDGFLYGIEAENGSMTGSKTKSSLWS